MVQPKNDYNNVLYVYIFRVRVDGLVSNSNCRKENRLAGISWYDFFFCASLHIFFCSDEHRLPHLSLISLPRFNPSSSLLPSPFSHFISLSCICVCECVCEYIMGFDYILLQSLQHKSIYIFLYVDVCACMFMCLCISELATVFFCILSY